MENRKEQTKVRLRDAMIQLLQEKAFDQISTTELVKVAQISRSGFYKHYRDKDDMIAKAGLISIDEKNGVYDKFWNRVMFPIMDVNSRVIGFGGRVMGDAKPKYLNSPETMIFDKSRNLYGLNRARRTKKPYFLLCEGYMDVISLHQAGFTNAVASLGTALTP